MSSDRATDSDREARLNKVLLDYVEALQTGHNPDRGQLLAAYPELRADLEEFFSGHDVVERLVAPMREEARELSGERGSGCIADSKDNPQSAIRIWRV